jgi:urease accessory protein
MDSFDRVLPDSTATRTLTLRFEQRSRSRQRVVLDDGRVAFLILPRGTILRDGDVLGNADGQAVRIQAAIETLSTAAHIDPAVLLRAAYHLGNRHVPVEIGSGWLRYLHDHVLDTMCRGLGLAVAIAELPFEPEKGAYAGDHSHSHRHSSGPASGENTTHGDAHHDHTYHGHD